MDWEAKYKEIYNQKVNNKRIISRVKLRNIKRLNEVNRLLFINYHSSRLEELERKGYISLLYNRKDIGNDCYYKLTIKRPYWEKKRLNLSRTNIYSEIIDSVLDFLMYIENTDILVNSFDYSILKEYYDDNSLYNIFKSIQGLADFLTYCNNEKIFSFNIGTFYNFLFGDIPLFYSNYPEPELDELNEEQRLFFKKMSKNLDSFIYIDVKCNDTYLLLYIKKIIKNFAKSRNIEIVKSKLLFLAKQYKAIAFHANSMLADCFILVEQYDEYFDICTNPCNYNESLNIELENLIEFKPKCTNKLITGKELLIVANTSNITEIALKDISGFAYVAEVYLKDFEYENGIGFLQYNLRKMDGYDAFYELENTVREYGDRFAPNSRTSTEEWEWKLKQYHLAFLKRGETSEYRLFHGIHELSISIERKSYSNLVHYLLKLKLAELCRKIENVYREERGIPHVGEGWVSETELYYRLKEYFDSKVEHHARPFWLDKQHLDIFFPEWNIGVEYQGAQHNRPVEFFGGEEQFKKQQANDRKKHKKCKENGCKLIYVYPNYNIDEVTSQIKSCIHKKNDIDIQKVIK